MTIIDDYLEYQEKYEKEYGEYTVVLMQVGHFFEAYAVDNDKERPNADNIYRLSDVMNIQMTRKNKNISENSRKNPLMIGVNIYSTDKYVQILLNANYTVVMIEQTTPPPDPEREVTNIYSPGINIQHEIKGDSSNCVCVYIEVVKDLKKYKDVMNIGLSSIDLSTGQSKIFETFSNYNDKTLALDEAFRFIQITDPKEILIYTKDLSMNKIEISGYLDLTSRVTHFKEFEDMPKEFFNINYQKTFLSKVFKNTGLLSVIEYIDCERKPNGLVSYIALLDFAYKHNEQIINEISKPNICEENNNLILTNNSINQLNVVSHASQNINMKFNSLYAVINNANTAIGRRYLRERLLNPITDIDTLNNRYDAISSMMELKDGKPKYLVYEESLKKIIDIERLHRRLGLKMLQPADFGSIDVSYTYIKEMLNYDDTVLNKVKPDKIHIDKFNEFIEEYRKDFDMDEIVKYHLERITNSFFNKNIIKSIDDLQESINNSNMIFSSISKKLSHLIEPYSNFVKKEYNEVRGHHLCCTTKRCNVLKTRFSNMNNQDITIKFDEKSKFKINPKDLAFKTINSGKTSSQINSQLLENTSNKLISNTHKIQELCVKNYLEKCAYYHCKYKDSLKEISKYVGNIDVLKSCAKTALMYGYIRPEINSCNNSFIDTKAIRHPIIERIQTDCDYVPNDIKLGLDETDSINGMLLYGTNAAGKSSLMKAVGLNLILAQAGMFVACEKFRYSPYKHIFTRINNNDNIFKGESSFAVEMSELRSILFRCNKNSLVLGDELCSGTESISAQSIFAASVMSLEKRNTCFIFATHLHELTKLEQIKNLKKVEMYHLKVKYCEETGKLIYDRKLEKGSGQAIYGLEVCKAMDMDYEFLENAHNIRKQILNESDNLLNTQKSLYNASVFVDKCMICGDNAEDVHHIKFQCTADSNNMIGHIQKDVKSNLVTLCKKCHIKVHNDDLEIHGYKQTSEGIILDYEYIKKENLIEKKKTRKKYNDEQIHTIKQYIDNNRNVNRNFACEKLKTLYNIDISKATLGKVISGKY